MAGKMAKSTLRPPFGLPEVPKAARTPPLSPWEARKNAATHKSFRHHLGNRGPLSPAPRHTANAITKSGPGVYGFAQNSARASFVRIWTPKKVFGKCPSKLMSAAAET